MTTPPTPASQLKTVYDREGYIIIPGLMDPSEFVSLKEASARVIGLTRSGRWPHRRTVGKQFPPFNVDSPDSWGVQHVMHPDLQSPEFVRWYTCDKLTSTVKELLDCSEDNLQMELFNILINPESHDFALRWHRDDVRENALEHEEREALAKSHYGASIVIGSMEYVRHLKTVIPTVIERKRRALYDDSCLFIVPRSHNNPRSSKQRDHSSSMDAPEDPFDMPGAMQVHLKAGETVFYNSNILHCAKYDHHNIRATLHACIGDTRGGSIRSRNVLQHGLEWIKTERFFETLPTERAKSMWRRLLEMERENGSNVGYSLEG